ncbi:MAG: hypothetical protein EXR58_01870 [Chloroflexi bacterium]|nr:hypothetical protein [Chloroflexota bacterium]
MASPSKEQWLMHRPRTRRERARSIVSTGTAITSIRSAPRNGMPPRRASATVTKGSRATLSHPAARLPLAHTLRERYLKRLIAPSLTLLTMSAVLWSAPALAAPAQLPPSQSSALCEGFAACGWGAGTNGQLGDGTQTDQLVPIGIPGLDGVLRMEAGGIGPRSFSLAVKRDGSVWGWGNNSLGQLGNGSTVDQPSPVQVPDLAGVVTISAGGHHSLALKSDGTVWAWGYNDSGQLGDGTTINRQSPVQVLDLTDVTALAAGDQHSLALKSDGTIWGWGANTYGALGDGTGDGRSTPAPISGFSGVTAVAAGAYHSLALLSDGTVWGTGYNQNGELGDGTTDPRLTPVPVSGLSNASAIGAGTFHSLALMPDGTVWTWGSNTNRQIGDGTRNHPVLSPVQVVGLSGVVGIGSGYSHTLAIRDDGTLWTWGWNEFGQLGDGTVLDSLVPVQVPGISGVLAAAGGHRHSLVILR